LLFFPFIVVLAGGTLWHLQTLLQCINYITFEFTPSTATLYPLLPDSWKSFNRYHFSIYMPVYTFLHHIHSPTPFPHHLPPLTGASPPPWAGPVLPYWSLILQKSKEKKEKKQQDLW
jgi:hypothetical protein